MGTRRGTLGLAGIARLYRARLRSRLVLVQELFAAAGIAVGVALLFASQVASTSLDGSVSQLTNELAGHMQLQLRARDEHGFDARLLERARRLPGVRVALGVVERDANLVGPKGTRAVALIGAEPRFAKLGGPLLRHFSATQLAAQHVLALPDPIAKATGSGSLLPVTVQTGANATQVLVGAELGAREIGALAESPIALAPLAYAQQLTDMRGRLTRIFVQAYPGRERTVHTELTRLAGTRANVQPADFDATIFARAAAPANQSTRLLAFISALVGFVFAINAMLLTFRLRRELVASLHREGATRRMTVTVLLFEALVLSVLASLLGLALGELLTDLVLRTNPGYLSFAFPVGTQRVVGARSVAIAVGAGTLVACIGVSAPLRKTFTRPGRAPVGGARAGRGTRVRLPTRALRVGAPVGGLACLAATTVILVAAPQAAVLGCVTLLAALLLFLPRLLDGAIAVFARVVRPLYAGWALLAIAELRAPATRARSVAVAATGAIAVFGSVAIQGAHSNLQRSLDGTAAGMSALADVWVAPAGTGNTLATSSFPGAPVAARLRGLPGVREVRPYRGGFLDVGDRHMWVLAPSRANAAPIPPQEVLSGNPALAAARIRAGGWVEISKVLAQERGLHVGQALTLPFPRPTPLRIAALITNMGWPPGAIVLNADDYARVFASDDVSALALMLAPGVSSARVRTEALHALGPGSALAVQTAQQRDRAWRDTSRQGLERLTQIATLMLLAAILAISIAMGAMIWQRRPQLAHMKMEGFRKGVLWRALLCESALLLGLGCSVGAVFGLYGQLLVSHALAVVTGFPIEFSVGVLFTLTSFALVSVTALAVVALPGWRATRVRAAPLPSG